MHTHTTSCSRHTLVPNLDIIVSHLISRVEEVISNGFPDTPRDATMARLAANAALSRGDHLSALEHFQVAYSAVKAQNNPRAEELLRALFDCFVISWRHCELKQSRGLVTEMIPIMERLEEKNGYPLLGTADLQYLKSYMALVAGCREQAIYALAACIAIRKKHLPAGNRLVALNQTTLEQFQ